MVPLISVVMPVRDGAATLMECLNSLVAQTFMDWELVLVDDGSLDASSRIAAHFAGRDTRVRVLRTSGVGIPLALNYGLQACRRRWSRVWTPTTGCIREGWNCRPPGFNDGPIATCWVREFPYSPRAR